MEEIHEIGYEEEKEINRGDRVVTIHFDGAYRFSYGIHEYGCGWVMDINGVDLVSKSFGGVSESPFSSNKAEYLVKSEYFEFDKLSIIGDSRLVINQISNKWKIHSGIYVDIAKEVKDYLYLHFHKNVDFKWTKRENNTKADKLSKEGLNNYKLYETETKNA